MDNIRRHMPNASISGDAIVGFPGETVRTCTCAVVWGGGFDRLLDSLQPELQYQTAALHSLFCQP